MVTPSGRFFGNWLAMWRTPRSFSCVVVTSAVKLTGAEMLTTETANRGRKTRVDEDEVIATLREVRKVLQIVERADEAAKDEQASAFWKADHMGGRTLAKVNDLLSRIEGRRA
jgi:hypothetical protein